MLAASPRPLSAPQLAARAGCTIAPINALRKKGLLTASVERLSTSAGRRKWPCRAKSAHELNEDQAAALAAIRESLHAAEHRTILIHGVTGSGKTEVYIQAIEEVVRFGRQAIVLVPEISLTPQTVARFRARFDRVAVLHSHLSDVERHEHWRRIARGEVEVVVGARSAIFAPTPHLGLIVLDEEHEATFKQESAPRYHARDVALRRAADQNVPLVLASATPSLESWQRAATGEFRLVEMPRRVFDRPLPAVRTIDLRDEAHNKRSPRRDQPAAAPGDGSGAARRRAGDPAAQSPRLLDAHPVPGVRPRGEVSALRIAADVSSARRASAMCHYCDYQIAGADDVPRLQVAGHALQRPGHAEAGGGSAGAVSRITRACGWTPTACSSAAATSRRWPRSATGEVRILLGTQMIAKGLDFPNVTLVGVINADTALHLARLPRGGADVSAGDASGRAHRARRAGGPGAGADVHARHAGDPGGGAARLRRVRADGVAASRRRPAIRRSRRWCGSWSAARAKRARGRWPTRSARRLRAKAAESGARAGARAGADDEAARAVSVSDSVAIGRWRCACGRLSGRRRPISRRRTVSSGPSTSIPGT